MNLNEYLQHALTTANSKQTGQDKVDNWLAGLYGESGELVDLIKKILFHGHADFRDKLTKEIGDVMWYTVVLYNELFSAKFTYDTNFADQKYQERLIQRCQDVRIAVKQADSTSLTYTPVENRQLMKILWSMSRKFVTIVDSIEKKTDTPLGEKIFTDIVEWCGLVACRFGITLDEVVISNVNKLKQRYNGGKFSTEASVKRVDVKEDVKPEPNLIVATTTEDLKSGNLLTVVGMEGSTPVVAAMKPAKKTNVPEDVPLVDGPRAKKRAKKVN